MDKSEFRPFVRVSSTVKKDETPAEKRNEINGIYTIYRVSSIYP